MMKKDEYNNFASINGSRA